MQEEISRFIEFGKIFDRPTRSYLVEYLKKKLHLPHQFDRLATALQIYNLPIAKALDKILESPKVKAITEKYNRVAEQVLVDLLKWLKKTQSNMELHSPFADEISLFQRWEATPAFWWAKQWYHLTNYLKETYTAEELDISFYEKKFEEILHYIDLFALEKEGKKYEKELQELEIIAEDLLTQWKALLTAKRLQWEMEQAEKEQEAFLQILERKIEEFSKFIELISPFANEVGRFWDISSGKWHKAGFELLEKYAQILQKEDSLRELAEMLGKMRQARTETNEEIYENIISRKAWVADFQKKDEIGEVYQDNYLPTVLPSEVAFLGDKTTENAFWKKYVEKELLSFRYQGKTLVQHDKIQFVRQQKIRKKEKGPFIVCVDTSGSMEGTPEQIAKTLCFAILKMASQENRKAYLINFSVGIKTINLSDLANSMDLLIEFLMMSFHGGTDASPALIEAIRMLQTNEYKEADVLMISDFVMFALREDIIHKIRQEQEKDTRFHSLIISNRPNPEIIHHFDNNWQYNPESKEVIKLIYKDLQSLVRSS
ncbi:MAG: VWA domain-containing protein [Raineya sp.]|nr:VWA domain-containing protein [Raineya sp.]